MKILTWNCNGALRKKHYLLNEFSADITIIQECEDPSCSKDIEYLQYAANHLWHGHNKSKGIGVFAKKEFKLESVELPLEPLELFLPCVINGEIPLLATWTKQANSPNFAYIGQLWKFLQKHKSFLRHPSSMVIGDLNSNKRWDEWDRWWNHTDVVSELSEIGLESAYHSFFSEVQGAELKPTLFLHRDRDKPYHIDYGFFGNVWEIEHVQVGDPDNWLAHSDHMPLMFNVIKKIT